MLIHGGWTFETRSTVSGFNALDLSPMTSANRDSIISSASEVESLDKAHVPPVTSLFWRVTARSLLQSARARARAGTARLRRKKRNCWLATKEKSEQAINYVSAIVASMLVFSLALVPTLVAIVSWKANVGLVKKSRRTWRRERFPRRRFVVVKQVLLYVFYRCFFGTVCCSVWNSSCLFPM